MTLRLRNRFRGEPSVIERCRCGRRLSWTVSDGREMVIHELPWCAEFEAVVGLMAGDSTRYHVAAVEAADDGIETVVLADGDSPDDVRNAQPSSKPS